MSNVGLVAMSSGFALRSHIGGRATPLLAAGAIIFAVGAYAFAYVMWRTIGSGHRCCSSSVLDGNRRFLTANGLLIPFLALPMYFHSLIWVASLWAVTFPGSAWTLAILFRRRWTGERAATLDGYTGGW
jgi:hypothetical protein